LTSVEDVFELLKTNYIHSGNNSYILNPSEKKIHELINNSPIHIDDIIKIANIDIKQLYEVLFDLQLKNEILCLAGNYYIKYNKTI
jgi:DNA processing protein